MPVLSAMVSAQESASCDDVLYLGESDDCAVGTDADDKENGVATMTSEANVEDDRMKLLRRVGIARRAAALRPMLDIMIMI
mmetsp:Transcript_2531/g.6317  ORF Transcript_2531/g.6317 Transcript_2531/m.6317 type:complete len:81 (+) Transcript_2531:138-380(+)